jgi:hypothetical protein
LIIHAILPFVKTSLLITLGLPFHITSSSRGKLFYRLVQQAMMIDPAPANSLKRPALLFLEKVSKLNLDPSDEDQNHNIL